MSSEKGNFKGQSSYCSERTSPLCNVCGKAFTEKGHVNRYCLIQKGIKEHVCHECGKAFTQKDDLKEHCLLHKGTKTHECIICCKVFTRKESLKLHSLIHKGIKDHVCNDCGKAFTQKGDLKKHSLIHKNVKDHVCNICGKAFTWKGSLKNHSLIHKGIKDHVCGVCGKAFTLKGTLEQHFLIHIRRKETSRECPLTFKDDESMKCNECGECFFNKDLLINHVSGHEPGQFNSDESVNSYIHEEEYQTKADQTQREDINSKSLVNENQNLMLNLDVKKDDDNIIKKEHEIDDYDYESLSVNLDVKKEVDDIKEENCDLTH